MKSPPWKVWKYNQNFEEVCSWRQGLPQATGIVRVTPPPQHVEGQALANPATAKRQKASGNLRQEWTMSNCPANTWHCGIEDGKKPNPTRVPVFSALDMSSHYLSRVESLKPLEMTEGQVFPKD